MGDNVLLLLSLVLASEGETQNWSFENCSSHCTIKFDENLSCWNKTAQFFDKTLMSILLRYVTTQNSIDRMVEHMESYYVGRDAGVLRREIINKTMIALVSASFKTIEAKKQPPLLACPQGCERISKFWLSCSFVSLLFSGLLTAIIAINKLEQDRKDRNLALVEKTVEIAKDKRN